jgi:hypothetical protein
MDAEVLLGAIPQPFSVVIRTSKRYPGKLEHRFKNNETGETITQDPRLGPLPEEWEAIDMEDEARLGWETQHYRHRETGETINSDPRMLPEELEKRGVHLDTICLV